MEIREKNNLLFITLVEDELLIEKVNEIVKKYEILEGSITGFGTLKQLDYGYLKTNDPIFYEKNSTNKLVTISNLSIFINKSDIKNSLTGIDEDGKTIIGRMYGAQVTGSFSLMIKIFETE